MNETVIHSTTQKFLDIFDITNNLVILKDGTTSLIIQVDAMNFGLLAEEEQDSIMYAYAGLLNSLNYPIQIIVHSQTKDVTGYLSILKDQEDTATSREKQQRIRRYREFVSNLIKERNVLDKKFYVTISATPLELGMIAPQSFIPGKSEIKITGEERTAVIEKARYILEPKRDHLLAQFSRIGLFSRQLTTQEMIQYFYISYNPEAAEGQQIADTNNYTTPMVTAGVEGMSSMNATQIPTPISQVAATAPAETQAVVQPTTPVVAPTPAIEQVAVVAPPVQEAQPVYSAAPVAPVPLPVEAQLEQVPQQLLEQQPEPVIQIERAPVDVVVPQSQSGAYTPTMMTTPIPLETPTPTSVSPEPIAAIHHTETAASTEPTVDMSVALSTTPTELPKPTLPAGMTTTQPISASAVTPQAPVEVQTQTPVPQEATAQDAINTTLGQLGGISVTPDNSNATLPPLPEI